jgi:uncharacterized membrane protein YkoI
MGSVIPTGYRKKPIEVRNPQAVTFPLRVRGSNLELKTLGVHSNFEGIMSIFAISRNITALALPWFLLSVPALADPPLTEQAQSMASLQGLSLTSVSLPRAIGVVEAKTGGKVMDIVVASHDGKPYYDAVVVKQGKVGTVQVSGKAGTVATLPDDQFTVGNLNWHDRADVSSFTKATVPLAAAIKNLEQQGSATAINAGLAKPLSPGNSVLAYNIEIVSNGQARRVAVDANTGEVIADPGALGLGDRDPGQFLQ